MAFEELKEFEKYVNWEDADDKRIYPMLYTLDELKRILIPIFVSHNCKEAILFGSYAKGCPTPYSDIDIFVHSPYEDWHFFGLLEDVCTALHRPVDLIDKCQVITGSRLDYEIRETGVKLL